MAMEAPPAGVDPVRRATLRAICDQWGNPSNEKGKQQYLKHALIALEHFEAVGWCQKMQLPNESVPALAPGSPRHCSTAVLGSSLHFDVPVVFFKREGFLFQECDVQF